MRTYIALAAMVLVGACTYAPPSTATIEQNSVCVFAWCNPYVATQFCTSSSGVTQCTLVTDYNPSSDYQCSTCVQDGAHGECPNFYDLQGIEQQALNFCYSTGQTGNFQCEIDYINTKHTQCQIFDDDQ